MEFENGRHRVPVARIGADGAVQNGHIQPRAGERAIALPLGACGAAARSQLIPLPRSRLEAFRR